MLVPILIYTQFLLCTALYTVAAAPFFAPAMLYCLCFDRGGAPGAVRFFILWYGKTILRIGLFPFVKIRYENRAGTESRGGIYVFNHRSASDPYLTSAITMRPPAQFVNDWPMRLPFLGFFARRGEYVDVRRLSYDAVLAVVRKFIAKDVPVMVFPEGTRSGGRNMNQFHGLVFRIAKELKCPLVPVAVAGNEEIPSRDFRIKCGTILIRKLPAIPPGLVESSSSFKLKNHVRSILLKETAEMDEILSGGSKS